MKKRFPSLAVLGMALCLFLTAFPVSALDVEYEKNGEIYMLIGGTDTSIRGIYNLNNKNAALGIQLLYDPGQAYGVNVDRNRRIFTYNISPTSDTDWVVPTGNIQIPGVPRLGTQSGTHHYAQDTGSKCVGCTVQGRHSISGSVLTMPNGFWYHMPSDSRARKITRKKWDQVYDLLRWDVGVKAVGSDPDIDKNRIAVKSKAKDSYYDINRCHDGCGGINGGGDGPIAEPVSDIAISGKGDAYHYKRTKGRNDGRVEKNGSVYSGAVIGDTTMNDPTTKFIAISTGSTNDFVYVLGNNVIKRWLSDANFGSNTPGFNLNDLDITDIVVSDQWWSTGGIVYAFDKPSNNVYKFVRNEVSGSMDVEAISIDNSDGDVDSIATDGFGSLYYVKTYLQPATSANFVPGAFTNLVWTNKDAARGYALGYAEYRQKISKGVFKLDIAGGAPKCVGEKVLGFNTFRRYIEVRPFDGSQNLTLPAIWDNQPYQVQGVPLEAGGAPVEIAAINFGTPPEVAGNIPGHVDIAGPYKIGTTENPFISYTQSEWTGYEENEFYMFLAENFPLANTNGINIRAKGLEDESATQVCDQINASMGCLSKNSIGWTGGLPTTVDINSVKYKWQVFQIKDRFDNDKDPDGNPLRRQVWPPVGDASVPLWSDAPILGIFFDGGDYEINLSIKYNWWNYDELPYGSTVADRANCYYQNLNCKSKDGTTTSKMTIHVKPKLIDELTDSGQLTLQTWNGGAWVDKTINHSTNVNNNYVNYYVIDQGVKCRWVLTERPGAPGTARTTVMTAALPPAPPAGTRFDNLAWDPQGLVTKWKFELPDPRTADPNDTLVTAPNVMSPTTDVFGIVTPLTNGQRTSMGWSNSVDGFKKDPKILSVPSDPYFYTVYANSYRGYSYDMFAKISLKDATGRIIMDKMVKLPYKRIIQLEAIAKVLVRDITPPTVFTGTAAAITPVALKTTTGDPVTSPSNGATNPTVLSMIFEDNNPFGNDSTVCTTSGCGFPAVAKHNVNNKVSGFHYQTCYEVDDTAYVSNVSELGLKHTLTPKIITIPNLLTKADADDGTKGVAPALPRKISGSTLQTAGNWNARAQFYKYTFYQDGSLSPSPADCKLTITPLTGAAIPTETQGGNRYSSYVRVDINLADLDEFSPQGSNFPTYYAPNRTNYTDLSFAFRATDSSGNASGFFPAGTIESEDTHRPYVTLRIEDSIMTNPVDLPRFLTNSAGRDVADTWHFINESDWVPQANGILATPFPQTLTFPLPVNVKASGATEVFSTDDPTASGNDKNLVEDRRYKVSIQYLDNVPTRLWDDANNKWVPNLPNQLALQDTTSSGFGWAGNAGLTQNVPYNYLNFRKAGEHWIEFDVRDRVLCTDANNDGNPEYPAGITFTASSDYLVRKIRYLIKVEDTQINVHTIESH